MPEIQTNNLVDHGQLKIQVTSGQRAVPIPNATIEISYTGDPDSVLETVSTDENGQTPVVDLPAPPVEYSMSPSENQPYSEYNLKIHSDEYKPVTISGAQILSGVEGLQPVSMIPEETHTPTEEHPIVIGPHTLWGNYPPKIAESEIKPVNESGEIVLSRVVIPEYIIVHDGPVGDKTAQNYYVRYKDYIKNVAACEIYSTWPRATLEANILAIMSFTLNRVYTEWYRNKGHDFTITSSTAYDHKFIPGKTTYNSINTIVDEIFADYLSRPNVRQPILTQYCDGKKVSCPEWMTLLQLHIKFFSELLLFIFKILKIDAFLTYVFFISVQQLTTKKLESRINSSFCRFQMYKKWVFFCFFIFARKYPLFIHNNTPFCCRNTPPFVAEIYPLLFFCFSLIVKTKRIGVAFSDPFVIFLDGPIFPLGLLPFL